ncbi:MAG: hypothetical protein ABI889_14570 [Gemmatimonadota bacterium]
MRYLSRIAIAGIAGVMLVGCAKKDQAANDSAAAASAMPAPAPAPEPAAAPSLTASQLAGKWQMTAVPESGKDTSPTKFVLTAKADTTGWMISFPTGVKVPLHVSISGDSVVETSDMYASQRRKGMKVKTVAVLRMQGDKLAGTTTAHYMSKGPDSVLVLRTEGTKMP